MPCCWQLCAVQSSGHSLPTPLSGWTNHAPRPLRVAPQGTSVGAILARQLQLADDYARMLADRMLLHEDEIFDVLTERCTDIEMCAN